MVGGTNADAEAKRLARQVPNVLVATPGRLVDHLQNYGATKYMSQLDTFVLDEADRLLDMGFRYSQTVQQKLMMVQFAYNISC